MTRIRTLLTIVTALLLTLGYSASQLAWFAGPDAASEYARKIDQPPVRLLALVLLVAAVVLAFVPEREEAQP